MMNKVAQYYRELVSSLSERLRHGERDIDALVTQAREKIARAGDLTQSERQAARALLSDYPLAGLQAITAFATQAQVSPATIQRRPSRSWARPRSIHAR